MRRFIDAVGTKASRIMRAIKIISSADGDILLDMIGKGGGATGPIAVLRHNSPSPAVNDVIGTLRYAGLSDAAAEKIYAEIIAAIFDPTNASADGQIDFRTMIANSLASRMVLRNGLVVGAATGGDQGAGTINATQININGAQPPLSVGFLSTEQTITAAGSLVLAHGLPFQPNVVDVKLQCNSAEGGYSVNDDVIVPACYFDGTNMMGCAITPDSTNLNIRFASAASTFRIPHKTTGAVHAITNANWGIFFYAYSRAA